MSEIRFYYDVVCPYAYIASRRIEALAQRCGTSIRWCPVLLGGIFNSIAAPQVPMNTWAPQRAQISGQDLFSQAALHNVTLNMPASHPQRTVDAMRLLIGSPDNKRPALTHALFAAYWVHGLDITNRVVLEQIAQEHDVDPSLITASASKQRLFEQTAEVVALGAFGVPVMAVGDRMWWGQDRLHFVEAALSKRPEPKPKNGEPTGNVIEFFHDFSSPFSYLASTQIERFATEHGATVQWCPILLGALFRSIGTPNVPLLAMSQARQQYLARDLQDWAAWWGVEFSFPTVFPVRTVLPLRISIAEPRAIQPLYHALWANNQDIGQPEIVAAVLDNAGLDAGSLIQQAATPAIKDHLRKNTARAEDVGACGVPSFYTNNTLVWGQDRMEMLSAILSGWHPTGN